MRHIAETQGRPPPARFRLQKGALAHLPRPWHFAAMTEDLKLAAEFPAASREDWLKLVRAALRDRPFERLTAKTYDGIAIEPLYPRAEEAKPVVERCGPWQVMARVDHPDPVTANAEALHELENGATGLTLIFAGSIGAYGHGLPGTPEAVARALEGVHLDAIAIELQTAEPTRDAADHVAALVQARGHAPSAVNIRFGHDAIGAHTLTGTLPIPYRDLMPRFGEHVASLAELGFKSPLTAADGRIVHNAGGSEAQELAYVLAVGVAYLRALEGAGLALDDARDAIEFRLTADADQFLTVAKFRALRKLWARAEQACGLDPKPTFISAETAWRMMCRRDPAVNMLRTTIAAFSAGIGGADAVAVLPFTAALGLPDRFARRVARNTGLLLLEESNLARVVDPAAGSGGIEDLTEKLCRAAWALFQEIEAAAGAPAALEQGLIQGKIAKARSDREAAVAHRKDVLTGTSDYPLLSETPTKVLHATPVALAPPHAAISYPSLKPFRLAEPYEALRDASDRILTRTGARPKVFLANLGRPAEFAARAAFASNFFEAGGIEAVGNDGFASHDSMVAAYKASGAVLACLCSSDKVYDSEAAHAATALVAAGAQRLFLAGRSKDEAALKSAGVTDFIFDGCNALAALRAAHAQIAS
jgi:methylmalonyl-CoA mutase